MIGASEKAGSVGRSILWNLISSPFGGTVYPVNPKRPNVLGIRAYPSIAAIPEPVDLAIVVTPAPTVPGVIGECADAGVKGAIIISAGFKEVGPEGAELERRVLEQARRGGMRLIGPNCLGVMNPVLGLNATFAAGMARRGTVGFLSQSGALCTAILDWSLKVNVGFSAFMSIGSMLDVGWGDLIDYLADDPETKCIVIYMETIGDARAFLSAAREVALTKPIIVIKAGRTEAAAKAAASHTGSMAGSDEVLDAAFRRVGVLRVNSISQVFDMADVLAKQPRPTLAATGDHHQRRRAGRAGHRRPDRGRRRAGEADRDDPEDPRRLPAVGLEPLQSDRHPRRRRRHPICPDARGRRRRPVHRRDAGDPHPAGDERPDRDRRRSSRSTPTSPASRCSRAGWAASRSGPARRSSTAPASRPSPTPTRPPGSSRCMWRSHYNLQALYETPTLPGGGENAARAREAAGAVVDAARAEGRTVLTEVESKRVLAAYGIPTVETRVAVGADEAVAAAMAIGFPVVLKLHSRTITHKTDVGGVQLNLADADAVRRAFRSIEESVRDRAGPGHFDGVSVQPMAKLDGYELIVGSSLDPQFGPVLLFGTGGQLVEVFRDRALGPAAAEHDAGPPDDGADPHPHRAQGCARPTSGRPGGSSSSSWSGSATSSSSSVGSRRSTSTRCWPRPIACWRWTHASSSTGRR